jgi:transposase
VGEYFRTYSHTPTWLEMLLFLLSLRWQLGRPLIVIWDRLPRHRQVANLCGKLGLSWLRFEFLPAYTPTLNPVEQLWSYAKYGRLANFTPDNLDELAHGARRVLHNLQRRVATLRGFFLAAGLRIAKLRS